MARGLDTILETESDSSSDESDTTAPAPAPAAANGEDANPTKGAKCVEAISTIVKEYICPITHELPIAPVMAKDGVVYERAAIERWFETKEGDPTSPSTGAVISTELIPAPQIRNTIEALVKSGAIDGLEVATAWKQKLADETKVKETRAKAEMATGKLCMCSACGTNLAKMASRKTTCRPAPGTSAVRRPATRKGWQCLVPISCVASVGPRTMYSGS